MGVLPSRGPGLPGPYTAAPFSHTQGSLSATGAKSFLTLVYCRPLAGQNRIPFCSSRRISSKISSGMACSP